MHDCKQFLSHWSFFLVPNSPLWSMCTQSNIELGRSLRAQELCESRGGRPRLPVPNSPYGLCGCKATLNKRTMQKDQSAGAV